MNKYLIIICGPTGIGKSALSIKLAQEFSSVIISCDSRQVYKEMKIGTAAPTAKEQLIVPHYFVGNHSVTEKFNVSKYENEVLVLLQELFQQHNLAFLTGGSGLYIDAVCKGMDDLPSIPEDIRRKWQNIYKEKGLAFLQEKVKELDFEYYKVVDTQNPMRLQKALEVFDATGKPYSGFLTQPHKKRPFELIKIGLNMDRQLLYSRINERVETMFQQGLVDEVKSLIPYQNYLPLNTVGYRELFEAFAGKHTIDEARELIKNHSRSYARRQLTWFRRDSAIQWFEPHEVDDISQYLHQQIIL